jgi:hypothetical protein
MKDNGHRTRDGGTEDGKQRSKGQEQWNRASEKGTLGQLIGVWGRRQGTNHVRQVTEDGRQGAEP